MKDTMDHPRIDDEGILDRYVAGRLPEADEAAFEEHLFACSACLEGVQAGDELRRGLRVVAAEDAARATQVATALGLMAWLRARPFVARAGVVGALVLLSALAVWQQLALRRLTGSSPATVVATAGGLETPIANMQVISLGVVRDGGAEPVVVRPQQSQDAMVLSLELPTTDATHYGVVVRDAQGTIHWQGTDLEPNLYDTLLVVVPPSYLPPGRYTVALETGGRPVGEMMFHVAAIESTNDRGPEP